MFLDYFALAIVLLVIVAVFYTFIYIHDIPYNEAKKRNHPQKEAIHVACWLSLFTLHAIWPIVFIWSISKQRPIEVAVSGTGGGDPDLSRRLARLEERLHKLEG
jgi:Na+/H+ antiporter NhaD/arsenite permease-like protein